MTEASVSSSFMTALRKRLPGAVVIKHRDASFIGLPDCSVTHFGVLWIEFKLWEPPKNWNGETCDVPAIAAKSPTQFDMMKRLNAAACAIYVVWAKRTGKCFTWCAAEGNPVMPVPQKDLVEWIAKMVNG